MKVLHYIPERLLSSEEEGGFHGSTDLTREYLSVLTTGMGERIESQVTTSLSQFKQQVKSMEPDIVHIHACWNLSAYRAQHWAMKQRLALVLSPHNGMQPWHVHHHFWLHKLPLLILYQRHAIKTADAIHVFSQSEHQRMKAMKWNSRLALVRNCTIDSRTPEWQMTSELEAFYQKVIDSNSFRLMTEEEKTAENRMLHEAIFQEQGVVGAEKHEEGKALPASSLRKIFIHANDEGILQEVETGARLMQQETGVPDWEHLQRFPRRIKKSAEPLEHEKILAKSPLTKSTLSNLRQDEKPSDTENKLTVMLINIQHELKHKKLSRGHLTTFYRLLRFGEYDEDKLQRMLKQLKLQKFTARLMQILQETYFLEEGYMPIPPIDDKRTNNIRKSLQQSDTL
jgi:hypothetical protein